MEIKSDVRRCSDELIQLLRSDDALRLNLFKMHDASKDHPMRKRAEKAANKGGEKAENAGAVRMGAEDTRSIGQTANENETVSKEMQKSENQKNNINMEGITMIKTMNIEGMMCGHCEARVKKALEHWQAWRAQSQP